MMRKGGSRKKSKGGKNFSVGIFFVHSNGELRESLLHVCFRG